MFYANILTATFFPPNYHFTTKTFLRQKSFYAKNIFYVKNIFYAKKFFTPILYANFLRQFFTPIFYANFFYAKNAFYIGNKIMGYIK